MTRRRGRPPKSAGSRIALPLTIGVAALGAGAWWLLHEPEDTSRDVAPRVVAPPRRPARPLVPPGSRAQADAEAAREHARAGRNAEALAALQRALALEPSSGALHEALGVALLQGAEPLAAKAALEEALRLLPGDADVLLRLGIACRELGLLDESERHLRGALERSGDSQSAALARAALGETLVQRAQRGVAVDEAGLRAGIEEYRRALTDGAGAFVRRLLARALLLQGDADGAIAELKRAAEADAGDHEARLALARLALDRGDLAEAERAAREAASSAGREATSSAGTKASGEAFHLLGRALAAKGDDAGAVETLRRALAADPSRAEALHELAGALRNLGRAEEAAQAAAEYEERRATVEGLRDRQRDARAAPDSAVAQYNLGVLLEEAGSADEALRAYQRALALDPALPQAHARLGLALVRKGALASAREHLLTAPPADAAARHGLAWASARLGRVDEAVAGYEALIAADPGAQQMRLELAATLATAGRLAEARVQLERVLEAEPGHVGALHDLGGVLLQSGDAAGAAAAFRKVLEQDPNHAGARRWLAVAEKGVGTR